MTAIIRFSLGLFCAALLLGTGTKEADAQATSACFQAPAKLPDDDVSAFISAPQDLLVQFPNAGLSMSARVRSLAGSSPLTAAPILALVNQASGVQRSAIGAGLARAARACSSVNPDYAAQIQQQVAAANNPEVTTAFLQASSEIQTAALGGGAAGGAGGAGGLAGGANTAGGTGANVGDSSVASDASTFGVAGSGSFTEGDRIVNGDVSPVTQQ
jgi:hypothetical protein